MEFSDCSNNLLKQHNFCRWCVNKLIYSFLIDVLIALDKADRSSLYSTYRLSSVAQSRVILKSFSEHCLYVREGKVILKMISLLRVRVELCRVS